MVALAGPRMEHHWLVRLGNCYRDRAERGQPEGMERGADAAHRRPAPRLFGLMLGGRRPPDRHGGLEGGKRYNRQYLYLLTITWRRQRPAQGRGREKRKRVRPPGSICDTTVAERALSRYTFHGGGPCNGALRGVGLPGPLSSGPAGQPWSAHAFAMRAIAAGSVTRSASPSMPTSA